MMDRFLALQLQLIFHFFNASGAYALSVEINDVLYLITENAGGLIFLQYDFILVNKHFKSIFLLDIQSLSNFNGKNNSAQFINFTYYTC